MYIVVTGAGPVGRSLAGLAARDGHDVVVIEEDEERARAVAGELDARVLHAAITEAGLADEAGLGRADALVATTEDDAANLMAVVLAREAGVERLVSVVNARSHGVLFSHLGADVLVDPEHLVAEHLFARLGSGDVTDASSLPDEVRAVLLHVREGSPLVGRTAGQCRGRGRMPEAAVVVAVRRAGTLRLPPGDLELQPDDRVTLLTTERLDRGAIAALEGSG